MHNHSTRASRHELVNMETMNIEAQRTRGETENIGRSRVLAFRRFAHRVAARLAPRQVLRVSILVGTES
jgi:hypothetical protein